MKIGQAPLITLSYWTATICEGASRIIIPLYFKEIGFSATKISLLFLFYEIFGFITNYLSGIIVNKYGYKKAFTFSMIAHTVASVGYLLPVGLMTNMFVLAAIRSFRGVGKELSKTTSSAYTKVLDAKKEAKEGKKGEGSWFIHLLLGGKDSVKGIGIMIGTSMYLTLGFSGSFLVLSALTAIIVFLGIFMLEDYREQKKVTLAGFTEVSQTMATLSVIRAFLYAGRDLWWAVALPIYIVDELGGTKSSLGTTLAVGLIVFGLAQAIGGMLIKKRINLFGRKVKDTWSYQQVMPISSYLLMLVPLSMILLKEDTTWLLVLVLLYNLFSGFATAPHNALHVSLADKDRASIDIAFYKTFSSLGEIVAIAVSGVLYDSYGITACLYFAVMVIFISGTLSMWLPDQEKS